MSTEEIVEVGHKEGPAWKIVAKYATYEEADAKRLEIAPDDDLEVKVHWQGMANSRYFAVKARQDPRIELEEALNIKRDDKRKRKAKMNKKRRKG